jgi:DNA-directed RNA polymerase subunit L
MDLKVTEETSNILGLQIEKEDFSIPDILHQELLKDPKVVFAGVHQIHPILKQYALRIESKNNAKPAALLVKAGESASKTAAEILKAAQRAFGETKAAKTGRSSSGEKEEVSEK